MTVDHSGKVFNGILVLEKMPKEPGKNSAYKALCPCGNIFFPLGCNLPKIKSCRVCVLPSTLDHGFARRKKKSKEYRTWEAIRRRCNNVRTADYPNYGGRGIRVEPVWDSFPQFLADVGEAPSAKHSIERIDVDGNYGPGNVRWATKREQMRNTRRSRFVEWRGETKVLAEWAEILEMPAPALRKRLFVRGWSVERAFTTTMGA